MWRKRGKAPTFFTWLSSKGPVRIKFLGKMRKLHFNNSIRIQNVLPLRYVTWNETLNLSVQRGLYMAPSMFSFYYFRYKSLVQMKSEVEAQNMQAKCPSAVGMVVQGLCTCPISVQAGGSPGHHAECALRGPSVLSWPSLLKFCPLHLHSGIHQCLSNGPRSCLNSLTDLSDTILLHSPQQPSCLMAAPKSSLHFPVFALNPSP